MTEIKITTEYEATKDNLKVIKTPDKIVAEEQTYNINEIKLQVEKINAVIELWNNKKKPLQDIIDKYEEIKPVEEIKEEEITIK